MLVSLVLLLIFYGWLCWSGYRFVRKYNDLLQEVVPEYEPAMFPYAMRPIFKLGLVGIMTTHSVWTKKLAEFLARELIIMSPPSRIAVLRKIDATNW